MSKKLTTSEFIYKSKHIHLDNNIPKYTYENTNYINSKTKVIIFCKIHGNFSQIAHDHLTGHGCPKCSGKTKVTTEEFIFRSKKIHIDRFGNAKYDYSKVTYINNKTKVKIICPIHGIFEQKAETHINQKIGCPKCSKVRIPTTEEFINKCKQIHTNEYGKSKYDYSKVIYINAFSKINIICPIHGTFLQVANYHLRGNGCPTCKESKGEKKLTRILISMNIVFEKWKRFKDCKNILPLPFDFYLPDYNICIEYDGELHYKQSGYRGNEKKLETTKMNDKIKDKYCYDNNINLIRIPYWDFDKIELILKKELNIS